MRVVQHSRDSRPQPRWPIALVAQPWKSTAWVSEHAGSYLNGYVPSVKACCRTLAAALILIMLSDEEN